MADRYQGRPFPADDDQNRRDDQHAAAKAEGDPLAELARLIGQTDPFSMGRANQPVQSRAGERQQYQRPVAADETPAAAAGPPPWMQRATRQEVPRQDYPSQDDPSQDDPGQDYPSAVHPVHRYATPRAAPEPKYHEAPPFADSDHEPDP